MIDLGDEAGCASDAVDTFHDRCMAYVGSRASPSDSVVSAVACVWSRLSTGERRRRSATRRQKGLLNVWAAVIAPGDECRSCERPPSTTFHDRCMGTRLVACPPSDSVVSRTLSVLGMVEAVDFENDDDGQRPTLCQSTTRERLGGGDRPSVTSVGRASEPSTTFHDRCMHTLVACFAVGLGRHLARCPAGKGRGCRGLRTTTTASGRRCVRVPSA